MTGLLTLRGMTREELESLLDAGQTCHNTISEGLPVGPVFEGSTVTTVFLEPSTRTRLSFERAARLLGADVMSFTPDSSSMSKGESFRDLILTLTAMGSSLLVIRHQLADAAELAARWSGLPVVNAGTGRRDHPSQTLIDALTLRQHFGGLDGLRMAVVGDIANSRVARSHLVALPTLGMELVLVAPPTLLPPANPWGVETNIDLDEVLGEVDVVYLLRIQGERGARAVIPSESAYARRYGLGEDRLLRLKPGTVVMHPGPVNRGVEVDAAVVDGDRSLILKQVSNGVPVRMAILSRALGEAE